MVRKGIFKWRFRKIHAIWIFFEFHIFFIVCVLDNLKKTAICLKIYLWVFTTEILIQFLLSSLFFYLPDLNHGLKPSLPTSAPILLFFTISHNKFLVSSCLVFRGLKQVQVMSGWANKIDSKIVFWGTTKGPYLEWNMGWNYAEYKMVAQLLQILLWWSWKIIW